MKQKIKLANLAARIAIVLAMLLISYQMSCINMHLSRIEAVISANDFSHVKRTNIAHTAQQAPINLTTTLNSNTNLPSKKSLAKFDAAKEENDVQSIKDFMQNNTAIKSYPDAK